MPHKQPNYVSSRHYVELAEQLSGIAFWNANMATGDIRGSERFLNLMELTQADTFNLQLWTERLHVEDKEELRAIFSLTAMGGAVARDVRMIRANRPARWIRIAAERSPSTGRLVGFVQDLSDERETKAVIYRERARMSTLLDVMRGVFWSIDPAGAILDLRGWEAVTGQSLDEARKHGLLTRVHPDERENLWARWRECSREKVPFEGEYRLRYADGVYRSVLARCLPVLHENGTVIEWLGGIEEKWRLGAAEPNLNATLMLKPQQLRAARAMLGWSAATLAEQTGVSAATISRYETTDEHMKEATVAAIIQTFERHGVVMVSGTDEIGLKLRMQSA